MNQSTMQSNSIRPISDAPKSPAPPLRKEIPESLVQLEPRRPLSVINDDPALDEKDAAEILGIHAETLKKWRQRQQGPTYIQYGKGGPVRYTRGALTEFRTLNTIESERMRSLRERHGKGVPKG